METTVQAGDDIGDIGPGDAVAQAQARQPVYLGEAVHDDDVTPVPHIAQRIGIIGVVNKVMP